MALTQRIRRVENQKELERVVDDFITTGYEVESKGENNAKLIKRGKRNKHLLIFLLTGWWTFGIGNLIYALIPAPVEDSVIVRIESQNK